MKAMILAAGRGERMRPLTDSTPKPLLKVRGKPLMAWHVEALARGGFTQLVVNTAWLGTQISSYLSRYLSSDASNPVGLYGNVYKGLLLSILYSHEEHDFGHALETAGGIARALPHLGEVFWVVAGDVFVPDFEFLQSSVDRFVASEQLAHLWLVPNPDHNLNGDFGLSQAGLALNSSVDSAHPRYTFSTIGLYRKALFETLPFGNPHGLKAPLAPLLRWAMDHQRVSAELYLGAWTDVGTPARLNELNKTSDQNVPKPHPKHTTK